MTPSRNRTPASLRKRPFNKNDPRKNMFDSPNTTEASLKSMDIQGTTPMDGMLRDTFAGTPLSHHNMPIFSPNINTSDLNKSLFGPDPEGLSSSLKTPKSKREASIQPIRFVFCDSDGTESMAKEFSSVSISPITHGPPSSTKRNKPTLTASSELPSLSVTFAEDSVVEESRDDSALLASLKKPKLLDTPKTPAPVNVTQETECMTGESRGLAAPSPFDTSSLLGDVSTPSTASKLQDQGFWSRQLGFSPNDASFTPFKSPGIMAPVKLEENTPISDADYTASFLEAKGEPSPKRRKLEDVRVDTPKVKVEDAEQ